MRFDRLPKTGQRGNQPVGGCDQIQPDIEAITPRLAVQTERKPVAATVEPQVERDHCPPRTDLGIALKAPRASHSAHPLCNLEPIDRNATEMKVKTRKSERLAGGNQFRRAQQRHPPGLDPVNMQIIVEPRAGRPFELDFRADQKYPAPVGHRDIAKPCASENRSVDPPDPDLQPARSLHGCDPIDDEAMTGSTIEEQDRNQHERNQRQEKRRQFAY